MKRWWLYNLFAGFRGEQLQDVLFGSGRFAIAMSHTDRSRNSQLAMWFFSWDRFLFHFGSSHWRILMVVLSQGPLLLPDLCLWCLIFFFNFVFVFLSHAHVLFMMFLQVQLYDTSVFVVCCFCFRRTKSDGSAAVSLHFSPNSMSSASDGEDEVQL